MKSSTKKLAVLMHLDGDFAPAGLLEITEGMQDGVPEVLGSNFLYGKRYLQRQNTIPIDPVSLPVDTPFGTQLFPKEGLTLFGAIRDAAPDGWGRRVIESELKAPLNSVHESTYLLEAGSERAGALDVRTSFESAGKSRARHSILRLEYLMDAAERIENNQPIPASLQDIFEAGTSLGGMRPKAVVEDTDSTLWLAKFSSTSDKMDIPLLECATLKLAKQAKLNVPPVRTELINGKHVMLIKRFDRSLDGETMKRHHMVSALTMLGCHESESRDKHYWDLADKIKKTADVSAIKACQKELFGRMVFNILVTNDDDHLRNHAFLWNGSLKSWELSPLYDVMPRPMAATERYLHLGVGEQGRLATIDNALTGYARFGLTLADAGEVVDRIWTVVREWKIYFESFGVPPDELNKIAPAFRHIDQISSKKTLVDAAAPEKENKADRHDGDDENSERMR